MDTQNPYDVQVHIKIEKAACFKFSSPVRIIYLSLLGTQQCPVIFTFSKRVTIICLQILYVLRSHIVVIGASNENVCTINRKNVSNVNLIRNDDYFRDNGLQYGFTV